MTAIGDPVSRVDGKVKVTGAAKYAAEFDIPNLATAVIVMSTISSGKIERMETATA
jgi:xanthine dehydrogenase YagR molybdenum-binding subunit